MEELARLIQNIIRLGTVIAVDHRNHRVRVNTGELQTNWLVWIESRAGSGRKTWDPPSVGEQVVVFSPGGDLTGAFVLSAISSDDSPPPSSSANTHVTEYQDGARFEYDFSTSTMSVSGVKQLNISASTEVNINSPVTNINGKLNISDVTTINAETTVNAQTNINGGLSVTAGGGTGVTMKGAINVVGSISQTGGKLESNGVVLDEHEHSGVVSGGSNTGGPVK